MRSLVLARDDNVGRHCIWWVYTFFRQKNKSYALNVIMYVQASLMFITTFNVEHLRCWEYYSTFVGKNRRKWVYTIFKDKRT